MYPREIADCGCAGDEVETVREKLQRRAPSDQVLAQRARGVLALGVRYPLRLLHAISLADHFKGDQAPGEGERGWRRTGMVFGL